MNHPPIRWWQRILQKLAMTEFISSWLLARYLHHIDSTVLRWSKGRIAPTTMLTGLPVIKVITTGAKSGKPRSVLLSGYPHGEDIVLIATSFGSPNHPAWCHNLLANPQAQINIDGETRNYLAHMAVGCERDRYWQLALDYYPGYQAYEKRSGRREIPVLVLEPVQ